MAEHSDKEALHGLINSALGSNARGEECEKQLSHYVEHSLAPVALFDTQMMYLSASRR
jgi:hypothetical protein